MLKSRKKEMHHVSCISSGYSVLVSRILFCQVHKLGKLRLPQQVHGSDRAVTLFGYDYLRNVRGIGIFVVLVITVQEHDHIGILLNGSGLTQVRKHRTVVGSGLAGTA